MKIVHVVRNIEYIGGAERFLISLLKNWHEKFKSDEIYLICLEGIGPVAKKLSKEYKFRLFDFPTYWWNPVDIFKLSRKINALNPDIVHTHLFQADFSGVLASSLLKLRVVSTKYCHFSRAIEKNTCLEKYFIKPICDNLLERLLSLLTNKTIVVSREVAGYFLRKGYKKASMAIIPCCHINKNDKLFNIPIRKINPSRLIKLGTVSRLVPEKGVDNLLDIFSRLYFEYENIKLYIAGDGFLKKKLQKQAKFLRIADRIHFLGHIDNISDFLEMIDIFLFTSHSEGFPLAIQEAMAAGKVIVSTNVGGIKELLQNNESGILFKDGNNNEAVNGLRCLLEGPNHAHKLALRARTVIRGAYNLDQIIKSMGRVYSDLV